ncbi:MAG TPA: hypothetical protein EYQ50_23845 [Verrucomicrobiales bacterium]|nr:hypothetical protein [Verrucomicrobiales bacterium]HIL72361.1 hypothetical protein [Verrucomicrobiota bacterium]
MKSSKIQSAILCFLVCGVTLVNGQTGPFDIEDWPETADPDKEVHYVSADPNAAFFPVGPLWFDGDLSILTGGDQITRSINIGGHSGVKTFGNYLNISDSFYFDWGDNEFIDILIQFYGDSAVLGDDGQPRDFTMLTGTLPPGPDGNLNTVNGGSLPIEAKNSKWNWTLFRIPNEIRPDGLRFIGEIAANAVGNTSSGGVNGGTIRFQSVLGLIVRLVAFGEEGAFGEPEQINIFESAETCDPEPETNLVFVDINQDSSDHLELLDNLDQTVTIEQNIGPANDKRKAVRADGFYMNFGITENFLGLPCNEPVTIKMCVTYYDDPALFGTLFGPEAFATDSLGGIGNTPEETRHVSQGTGEWVHLAFVIPAVNLAGVNTAPLTGGPRLIFDGAALYVSRVDIGIIRSGDHPLAGVDPLPDCFEDPLICTDLYGQSVELNFADDTQQGLAPGNSGGDQEMIQEEAGPEGDRRMAIRPAFDDGSSNFTHNYLNFAITDEALGPNTQPNAQLAICITYYDDPALTGASFRPEVYQSSRNGQTTFAFTTPDIAISLAGSGEWRGAYFEIPDLKFNGVNQGPQAAARFFLTDKIFFSRIRYAIIRPCGPSAGINLLEDCKPPVSATLSISRSGSDSVRVSWPLNATDFTLEGTGQLNPPAWTPSTQIPEFSEEDQFVILPATGESYFRLKSN